MTLQTVSYNRLTASEVNRSTTTPLDEATRKADA